MSRLSIHGDTSHPKDVVIQDVLNAVLGRLAAIKETLRDLETDLVSFRQRFGLSDTEFLNAFHAGDLGDDEDYFAWEGSLKLRAALLQEESSLREVL